MSGRYQKRLRREFGISIDARRSNAEFLRLIETTKEQRAADVIARRRALRRAAAWVGLVAMLAALVGAFFL